MVYNMRDKLGRFIKGSSPSPNTQFKKGIIPWNKGIKDTVSIEGIENIRRANLGNKYGIGRVTSEETKRKQSLVRIGRFGGKNHPNWQGGITFEKYPLGWNKTFKEQIRYRDGYRCQICGKPEVEHGKKLHIHHIDYDKNNLNEDNLITLCNSCHCRTNFRRDYWIEVFTENKKEVNHG